MKREELKALGLSDEQIDGVMKINGIEVEANKKIVEAKDAEISKLKVSNEGLSTQIKDRDKDIKELQGKAGNSEEISKQLGELQAKYADDTASLKKKLDEQQLEYAVDKTFAGVPFASALARKAAMADFKAKGYKVGEDGKFAEAQSFIDQLKKDDPAAFKAEEKDEEKGGEGEKDPKFAKKMGGDDGGKNTNPFFKATSFNLVRPIPKEQ